MSSELKVKPIKSVIEKKKKELKKRKKSNNVKPTAKQKKAFKKIVENRGNISKSMRESGYTEKSAKNPKNLTESKGWEQLMEEYLPDEKLAKVHEEGLEAVKNEITFEGDDKFSNVTPDHAIRHKFLDTAYKVKKVYSEDKLNISIEEAMRRNIEDRQTNDK